jgi:hypothetical protein
LPDDFLEFHQLYDEALLTTRTYPIHLWSEEKILEGIEDFRDLTDLPIRFFRFAEYWDQRELWYGLWLDPGDATWKVAVADMSDRDQIYEENISEEYILSSSFRAWLKDFIRRDGLPDPYKGIGPEGGFLDPA